MKIYKNTAKKMVKNRKSGLEFWMGKDAGIDGILVTVGLCIIALVLCVVMKDSLTDFIQTIVTSMGDKAEVILGGAVIGG